MPGEPWQLVESFLKDFLRDVGGTLRGRCRGNLRGCRGNLGGILGSTFLKDFYRGGRGTLQELITETGWGTPPRGGSPEARKVAPRKPRSRSDGTEPELAKVVRTPLGKPNWGIIINYLLLVNTY